MPLVDVTGRQNCPVEEEKLFLPSDFVLGERQSLRLTTLAINETRLREGQAFDALLKICGHVKCINSMWHRKAKDVRGVSAHTRSLECIRDAESRRDAQVMLYEAARQALIRLDVMDDSKDAQFPKLEQDDMARHSTEARRQTGDSKRHDGRLWVNHGRKAASKDKLNTSKICNNDDDPEWETVEDSEFNEANKSRKST